MLSRVFSELDYQKRSLKLALGFLTGRFIHCNLQVTYRCNFSCEICDFWKTAHEPEDELTLDDISLIGGKLGRLGTLIVSLAGGEPLIRPDLPKIAHCLKGAGHFPILITNGWFVTDKLGRELIDAGLQEISVSLDYADQGKHDRMRGREGAWQRAVDALDVLNRCRTDRRNRVHMISVLMDDNLGDIEPLIKLARKLGVTYMVNLYSWNRGAKRRRLPHEKVTAHLLELKKKYPEFVTLTSYIERLDDASVQGGIPNCQTGRLLMNIDNRGFVSRCTEMLDRPVGNILADDIMDIRDELYRVQKNESCAQCWTSCRGFAESMRMPPRLRQFREFHNSVKRY